MEVYFHKSATVEAEAILWEVGGNRAHTLGPTNPFTGRRRHLAAESLGRTKDAADLSGAFIFPKVALPKQATTAGRRSGPKSNPGLGDSALLRWAGSCKVKTNPGLSERFGGPLVSSKAGQGRPLCSPP